MEKPGGAGRWTEVVGVIGVNAAGPWIWVFWIATFPVAVIGIRSSNRRYHAVVGTVFLAWEVLVGIATLPRLGFWARRTYRSRRDRISRETSAYTHSSARQGGAATANCAVDEN